MERILNAGSNGPLVLILPHLSVVDMVRRGVFVCKAFRDAIEFIFEKEMVRIEDEEYDYIFGYGDCVGETIALRLLPMIDLSLAYGRGRVFEHTVVDIFLHRGFPRAYRGCIQRGVVPKRSALTDLMKSYRSKKCDDENIEELLHYLIMDHGGFYVEDDVLVHYALKQETNEVLKHLLVPQKNKKRNYSGRSHYCQQWDNKSFYLKWLKDPTPRNVERLKIVSQYFSRLQWGDYGSHSGNPQGILNDVLKLIRNDWSDDFLKEIFTFSMTNRMNHQTTNGVFDAIKTRSKTDEKYHSWCEYFANHMIGPDRAKFRLQVPLELMTHFSIGPYRNLEMFKSLLSVVPKFQFHYTFNRKLYYYPIEKLLVDSDETSEEFLRVALESKKLKVSFESICVALRVGKGTVALRWYENNIVPRDYSSKKLFSLLNATNEMLELPELLENERKSGEGLLKRLVFHKNIRFSLSQVESWMKEGEGALLELFLVKFGRKISYRRGYYNVKTGGKQRTILEYFEYCANKGKKKGKELKFCLGVAEKLWESVLENFKEDDDKKKKRTEGLVHCYLNFTIWAIRLNESEEIRKIQSKFVLDRMLKNEKVFNTVNNPCMCSVYKPEKKDDRRDVLKGLLKHSIGSESKILTSYLMDRNEWIGEENGKDYWITDLELSKKEKLWLLRTFPGRFDDFSWKCKTCSSYIRHFERKQFEEEELLPMNMKPSYDRRNGFVGLRKEKRKEELCRLMDKFGIFSCQICSFERDVSLLKKNEKKKKKEKTPEFLKVKKLYNSLHCRYCVDLKVQNHGTSSTAYLLYCKGCMEKSPYRIRNQAMMREQNVLYDIKPIDAYIYWFDRTSENKPK